MNDDIRGKYYTTADGRKSFEIYQAEADLLLKVLYFLKEEFNIVSEPMISRFDGHYIEASLNESKLTIGWDVWSGLFINAKNEEGNQLIERIGQSLNEEMRRGFFEK